MRERDVIDIGDIGDKHTVENKKKLILVQDKMDKGSNKKHSKQQTYLVGKHLVMLLLCKVALNLDMNHGCCLSWSKDFVMEATCRYAVGAAK